MNVRRIPLGIEEKALWDETGSRGDAFRAGIRQQAAEELRATGVTVEVVDPNGGEVEALFPPGVGPPEPTTKDG